MHLALDKLEIREAGRACARKPASSFLVSTAPTRSSNATPTMLDIVTAVKVQEVSKRKSRRRNNSVFSLNSLLDS